MIERTRWPKVPLACFKVPVYLHSLSCQTSLPQTIDMHCSLLRILWSGALSELSSKHFVTISERSDQSVVTMTE